MGTNYSIYEHINCVPNNVRRRRRTLVVAPSQSALMIKAARSAVHSAGTYPICILRLSIFLSRRGEFFIGGESSPHVPVVQPRVWEVKPFNYDNCAAAMMTLFAVQTSEGWVVILQDSMSSTYEDEGPIPWFRTEMAIFYIVYFIVFPFFFVNIFVALVIVTFNELGEAELTEDIDKNQVGA